MAKVYTSNSGVRYSLEKELGVGGEGIVYTVNGLQDIVAKIYKPEKFKTLSDRVTMERKLKAMLAMKVPTTVDGVLRLAWPQDILYENGTMVGFTMPRVNSTVKIFHMSRMDNNPIKDKIYPNYTWKYSVQYAYNLAWVVDYVHKQNFVIGDLNPNNIVIDPNGSAVILIDCDSFDIRDPITGEHFPCGVGLEEMLAPELQTVGNLSNGEFTRESDNFSLAIHIFRLLMYNADPFGGIVVKQYSSSSAFANNQAVINGECAYVRTVPGKTIPDWSPKFNMLPTTIQQLFRKTFDYTALTALSCKNRRATAEEWKNALLPLGLPEPNSQIKTCSVNKKHVYPAHNSECPWCEVERKIQLITIPSATTAYHQSSSLQPATNMSAGGQTHTSSPAANRTSYSAPARKAYPFYILAIMFGILSGVIFAGTACEAIEEVFDYYISPEGCGIILGIIGVICGAVFAHILEDYYTHAFVVFPWLLLTAVMILVPAAALALIGLAIWLIMLIVGVLLGILAIALCIAVICACANGS